MKPLVSVVLFVSACVLLGAQEAPPPKEPEAQPTAGVPLLGRIPLLSHLFQQQQIVWFPLSDGDGTEDVAPKGGMTFFEKWLRKALSERFPGISSVIVERRESYFEDGQTRVSVRRGLEVTAPTGKHPDILGFLQESSTGQGIVVTVSLSLVELKGDDAKSLLANRRGGECEVEILDARAFRALGARPTSRQVVVCAPTLSVRQGQTASAQILNQLAYVKDYRVERVGEEFIADPEIDTLTEGVVISVTPIVSADRRSVTLAADLLISTLMRPIRETKVPLKGLPQKVTVQLPELRQCRWSSEEVVVTAPEGYFRVTGLVRSDASEKISPMELWGSIRVHSDSPVSQAGEVVGVDRDARKVFVRRQVPGAPASRVWRAGQEVGELSLEGRSGDLEIYRLVSGDGRAGDVVR